MQILYMVVLHFHVMGHVWRLLFLLRCTGFVFSKIFRRFCMVDMDCVGEEGSVIR